MTQNKLIQPTGVTGARYNYTATQKNILYSILVAIKDDMTFQRQLFDSSRKYAINIEKFTTSNNYDHALVEAEDMIGKTFRYSWKDDNGKTHDAVTTMVASASKVRGAGILTLEIPSGALPVLLSLKAGFTELQLSVALTLKSKYSKRMYEFCGRWADKGGYDMSLEKFRELIGVEDGYADTFLLKKFVLETAKKELKAHSDVWFEYDLKKIKSRSFNWIYFKIFKNDPKQANAERGVYPMVYNFLLLSWSNMFNDKAVVIAGQLDKNEVLSIAWSKFRPLLEKYNANEIDSKHLYYTTKKILKEDFNIATD